MKIAIDALLFILATQTLFPWLFLLDKFHKGKG